MSRVLQAVQFVCAAIGVIIVAWLLVSEASDGFDGDAATPIAMVAGASVAVQWAFIGWRAWLRRRVRQPD